MWKTSDFRKFLTFCRFLLNQLDFFKLKWNSNTKVGLQAIPKLILEFDHIFFIYVLFVSHFNQEYLKIFPRTLLIAYLFKVKNLFSRNCLYFILVIFLLDSLHILLLFFFKRLIIIEEWHKFMVVVPFQCFLISFTFLLNVIWV